MATTSPPTHSRRGNVLSRIGGAIKGTARKVAAAVTGADARMQLPPSPFVDWEYGDVEQAVDLLVASQTIDPSRTMRLSAVPPAPGDAAFYNPRSIQDPMAVNRAFYDGDHWMAGAGWIGPHPQNTDDGFSDAMNEIALGFTSQNVVREVTKRHTSGVVGKSWQWSYVPRRALKDGEEPTSEETAAIDEATALMRQWMQARKITKLMRDLVATVLLAERSAVRLYVPEGLTQADADGVMRVKPRTMQEALGLIWADHPRPEFSGVVVDDDTKLECGAWLYESDVDDDNKAEEYAGVVFLDESGKAITKLIPAEDKDAHNAVETELDLGGRLPMFELRRSALITPQVQQAQRALNLALSTVPRNIITAGFLERILLNAQMPGTYETDADGKLTGKFIPAPLHLGAGATNFIQGTETEKSDGSGDVIRATPSVVFREPVDPGAAISAIAQHYHSILDETGQLHVIMSGDANASGTSRVEARAEYLTTLQETQPEAEAAIRFITETTLAMAEALLKKPGLYTSLIRAQAAVKLDAGPLSAQERATIEASIGKTLSQETAMAMLGVDDIDGEKTKMAADPSARAALGTAIGQALYALTTPGASLEGAARFIGIEQKQLDDLLSGDRFSIGSPGNPVPPPNPVEPPAPKGKEPTDVPPKGENGSGGGARPGSGSGSAAGGQ